MAGKCARQDGKSEEPSLASWQPEQALPPQQPHGDQGLWLHNPQCSLEPRGTGLGWALPPLGGGPAGRGLRGIPAPEELCRQRTETWKSVSLDGESSHVSKQEASLPSPWRRKINSGDLFFESGKTYFSVGSGI